MIRIGVLTPHAAIGPEAEFPEMAPGRLVTRVARVSTEAADIDVEQAPPTRSVARIWTAPPFLDDAAEQLAADPVDVIGYASTSSGYAIGFDDETAMVARLSARAGVPVVATCVAGVLAIRALGVDRIALIDPPWFDAELNALGAAYFRSQGVEVVASMSADLAQDPGLIEPAAVCEWTSRRVPDDAEAVFIGGNGFRAAGAIDTLEATIGRPVLTSNQVLLWNLLALAGATFQVSGYGQLFAHRP